MPRLFVCYGGDWKEKEKEYEGGELRGLVVDLGISYDDFLHQIYRISGINSDEFDLIIRCLYNIKPKVAAFVIRNEEDLHFFLTGEDVSQLALLVSTTPKEVNGGRSDVTSFPYTLSQNTLPPSHPSVFDNMSQYSMGTNVHLLTPSSMNVVPNDVQDDREAVTYGESATDMDQTTYVDVKNVEHVTVGDSVADAEQVTNEESVIDREPIAYVTTYEELQWRKPTRQPSNETNIPVVISGQCSTSDEDVSVGQLFLSKKELRIKLSILAMKKNFEFRAFKSRLGLYVVKCVEESCTWRLRAAKFTSTGMFKVSKYSNVHSCSHQLKNHDHRHATSLVVSNLIKWKYEDIGLTYKPKDIMEDMLQEYGVTISYDKAWRAIRAATPVSKVVRRGLHKTLRIPSTSERHQTHKCSRCGNIGHNRKTCRQLLTDNS